MECYSFLVLFLAILKCSNSVYVGQGVRQTVANSDEKDRLTNAPIPVHYYNCTYRLEETDLNDNFNFIKTWFWDKGLRCMYPRLFELINDDGEATDKWGDGPNHFSSKISGNHLQSSQKGSAYQTKLGHLQVLLLFFNPTAKVTESLRPEAPPPSFYRISQSSYLGRYSERHRGNIARAGSLVEKQFKPDSAVRSQNDLGRHITAQHDETLQDNSAEEEIRTQALPNPMSYLFRKRRQVYTQEDGFGNNPSNNVTGCDTCNKQRNAKNGVKSEHKSDTYPSPHADKVNMKSDLSDRPNREVSYTQLDPLAAGSSLRPPKLNILSQNKTHSISSNRFGCFNHFNCNNDDDDDDVFPTKRKKTRIPAPVPSRYLPPPAYPIPPQPPQTIILVTQAPQTPRITYFPPMSFLPNWQATRPPIPPPQRPTPSPLAPTTIRPIPPLPTAPVTLSPLPPVTLPPTNIIVYILEPHSPDNLLFPGPPISVTVGARVRMYYSLRIAPGAYPDDFLALLVYTFSSWGAGDPPKSDPDNPDAVLMLLYLSDVGNIGVFNPVVFFVETITYKDFPNSPQQPRHNTPLVFFVKNQENSQVGFKIGNESFPTKSIEVYTRGTQESLSDK